MVRSLNAVVVMGTLAILSGCGSAGGAVDEGQQAAASEVRSPRTFLATGDSIAFGFNPLVQPVPTNYVGYPEVIAGWTKWADVNTSCPGETSGSFLSATAPDNGCRNWKAAYALHADYEGTQIDYLTSYIKVHPEIKYLTIDIGANDLLLIQNVCQGDLACTQSKLPAALNQYGTNLATIYGTFRAAGFTGQLIAMNTYATNYNDPLFTSAIGALNNVLASVTTQAGGKVADAYTSFQKASADFGGDPCAAGLLIKMPDGTCNIHPNEKGRNILAATVLSQVDY